MPTKGNLNRRRSTATLPAYSVNDFYTRNPTYFANYVAGFFVTWSACNLTNCSASSSATLAASHSAPFLLTIPLNTLLMISQVLCDPLCMLPYQRLCHQICWKVGRVSCQLRCQPMCHLLFSTTCSATSSATLAASRPVNRSLTPLIGHPPISDLTVAPNSSSSSTPRCPPLLLTHDSFIAVIESVAITTTTRQHCFDHILMTTVEINLSHAFQTTIRIR